MILEVRTYTAQPGGGLARWLDFYEKNGLPPSLKHLGGLVGFFVSEIGPLNQIVHMWRYESLAIARRAAPHSIVIRTGKRFLRPAAAFAADHAGEQDPAVVRFSPLK